MADLKTLTVDGKTLLDLTHPIGSVYLSTINKSPELLFGGTWEEIEPDSSETSCFLNLVHHQGASAKARGGESSHQLTIDELPSHRHEMPAWNNGDTNYGSGCFALDTWRYQGQYNTGSGWAPRTQVSSNTGSGQAFSTIPPYYTVYGWVRTA